MSRRLHGEQQAGTDRFSVQQDSATCRKTPSPHPYRTLRQPELVAQDVEQDVTRSDPDRIRRRVHHQRHFPLGPSPSWSLLDSPRAVEGLSKGTPRQHRDQALAIGGGRSYIAVRGHALGHRRGQVPAPARRPTVDPANAGSTSTGTIGHTAQGQAAHRRPGRRRGGRRSTPRPPPPRHPAQRSEISRKNSIRSAVRAGMVTFRDHLIPRARGGFPARGRNPPPPPRVRPPGPRIDTRAPSASDATPSSAAGAGVSQAPGDRTAGPYPDVADMPCRRSQQRTSAGARGETPRERACRVSPRQVQASRRATTGRGRPSPPMSMRGGGDAGAAG